MPTRRRRLNRKVLLAKLVSIEGLLLQSGLTDAQARKFALIEIRELIESLNKPAKARGVKGVSEEVASRNGGD